MTTMPDPETLAKLTAREIWSLGYEAGWAEYYAEGLAEARAEGVREVCLSFAREYLPDEQFRALEHRPTDEVETALRADLIERGPVSG